MRYDPSVLVPHTEPGSRAGLLARRFRYGTSAGPLAVRHPEAMAPLALQPWPAVAGGGLLARKPAIAAAGFATAVLTLSATLRRAGVPARGLLPATVTSTRQTWLGVGRYLTQFAAPLLIAGIARPGGGSAARRWGRRTAAASLLLGPPLTAWAGRRPGIGPVPFALGHIADDVCYGAGVWAGPKPPHRHRRGQGLTFLSTRGQPHHTRDAIRPRIRTGGRAELGWRPWRGV